MVRMCVMAYQRSTVKGPGSNQYGDKPPLPPSPFEQQYRQQRSHMIRGAVTDLTKETDADAPSIDLSYFYNEQSGLTPSEWEQEFIDTADNFVDGRIGAGGKLFGLMQYVPPGAVIPEYAVEALGPKLQSAGLFNDDPKEEFDSDAAAVAAAFDRALYTRLYTEAFREETRVLGAIEAAEGVLGKARHLVGYLGEKNPDPKMLDQIVSTTIQKIGDLDELAIGDTRERSHVKANMRVIKKDIDTIGSDRKRIKEHAFAVENHATVIDRQVRGEYVRRAPFWMEAVHNRSFFALRSGNYPNLEQYLDEMDAMAQKAFECTNGLPVREGTARKRHLKRVQRAIRNIQQAMAPYANEGEEPFRPPDDIKEQFAALRTAIFS
jgi:hypothetical protein